MNSSLSLFPTRYSATHIHMFFVTSFSALKKTLLINLFTGLDRRLILCQYSNHGDYKRNMNLLCLLSALSTVQLESLL